MNSVMNIFATVVAIGLVVIAINGKKTEAESRDRLNSLEKRCVELAGKHDELGKEVRQVRESVERLAKSAANSVDATAIESLQKWVAEIDEDLDEKFDELVEKQTYHDKWLRWCTQKLNDHARKLRLRAEEPTTKPPKKRTSDTGTRRKEARARSEKYSLKGPRYHGSTTYRSYSGSATTRGR